MVSFVFPQHVLLFAVSPEAGGGSRETAHKAAEDIGGAESLPEAAREVGKHELQGDQEPLFINFLHLSTTIVTITIPTTTIVIDDVLKICISGELCASST